MSIRQLITFPLIPEEVYDRVRTSNRFRVRDLHSMKSALERVFSSASRGDTLCQLILMDFYLSINHENVHKDNSTGRKIETKLSRLFALSTGDDLPRENPNIDVIMTPEDQELFDDDILTLVTNNYREKGDLFFINSQTNSLYKLSIKSLVPSNNEINFGAFEFLSTIKGLPVLNNPLHNLQERNRSISFDYYGTRYENVGLGSAAKLRNVWSFIQNIGLEDEYLNRFKILLKAVYKDDFLIYIKDPDSFKIYLLKNEDFIEVMLDKVRSGFTHMRVEGNGLRVSNLSSFTNKAIGRFVYRLDSVLPDKQDIINILVSTQSQKVNQFLSL